MSKFLLNLLLQISKALVNSKIQFLNLEILFLDFSPADLAARPTSQPRQPTGHATPTGRNRPGRPIQPARRSRLRGKYVFPFGSCLPSRSPLPRLSVNRAPDVSSIPHLQPPVLARAATDSRSPSAAQLRASGAIEPLPPHIHFPSLNFPP
jgi:hypothetical protein